MFNDMFGKPLSVARPLLGHIPRTEICFADPLASKVPGMGRPASFCSVPPANAMHLSFPKADEVGPQPTTMNCGGMRSRDAHWYLEIHYTTFLKAFGIGIPAPFSDFVDAVVTIADCVLRDDK
jgi:hypothetical protein